MTDTNDIAMSGEARLKSRRYRFFRFCAIGFAAAFVTGLATGYAGDLLRDGTVPAWLFYVVFGITLASLSWFTWEYFRRVDELDLLDNLWASMIAIYFYIVALPSWYLFHDLDLVGEPNQVIIYIATSVVLLASYGLRKLGLR